MSAFAGFERLVSEAIDEHFGEEVRVESVAKTSKYMKGSAAHTPITATAIVDFNPVALISQDVGKYDGSRPAIAGDKVHVSFDEKHFPDWKPRSGDRIVLLDRGDEILAVSYAEPDGLGRIVCVCSRHTGPET